MPVAVAGVDPVGAALAVAGAAHRLGLRREQRIDERGEQITHQIRARLGQLLGQELGRVDTGSSGHRGVLLRVGCERSLEGSTRWPRLRWRHALTQVRRTPLCWTPLTTGRRVEVAEGRSCGEDKKHPSNASMSQRLDLAPVTHGIPHLRGEVGQPGAATATSASWTGCRHQRTTGTGVSPG